VGRAAIIGVSDESSNNDGAAESSSDSAKESSPETPDASEEREARKANARAVGVDTAFLDALGDEFADAPAPVGKYGPGGTLVAEDADEAAAVTGIPKTKLPPPPPGLASKKERDEVLKKDFLQETTPTLELEGKDEGEVLFESAAVGGSGSERLDLKSGANPVVPDDDDGLPDVLASFDSEASDPGNSGNDLVVSVGEMPKAEEVSASATDEPAESEPESESESEPESDDDDAKAAVVVAKPEPKSEPTKAAAAAPAAPRPPANDGPDIQKYAVIGFAVLLLLLGSYALMSGDDKPKSGEVAQAGAAGKDKAAPAADGGQGGGAGGGAADGAGDGGDGGGGGGDDGNADGADEGSAPAGADGGDGGGTDGAAADAADSAAEGEAAAATDADEAAAEGADTEGAAEASTGDVDIAIDDDGGDDEGGGGGGVAPISGNAEKKKQRAAEDEMTAKELRDAAKAALKKRKYGEAYRLSGKAIRKESTEPAHAIRVEAACGMKNQAAAKSAFERINTGKVKRDLRSACREHDVRLGL